MERLGGGNLLGPGCQSSAKHRCNDSKSTVCKAVQGWDVNIGLLLSSRSTRETAHGDCERSRNCWVLG